MNKEKPSLAHHDQQEQGSAAPLSAEKKPWQEPKLAFIEPKLTKHGKLKEVTGGFFGGFSG